MKKLKVTSQTKANGSSKAEKSAEKPVAEVAAAVEAPPKGKAKAKNGVNGAPEEIKVAAKAEAKPNGPSKKANGKDQPKEAAAPSEAEPKRRGRQPEEGEPLKRLLVFLSEGDIASLKTHAGDKRGLSTKVREIIKEYLAKA